MTRVSPIVLPALAVLGLVVAVLGLVLGWSEIAPIGFFVLIFCTILTTMQRSILAMEPYQAPATTTANVGGHGTATPAPDEDDDGARIYDVPDERAEAQTDRPTE